MSVPGAIVGALFARAVVDGDALQAAPFCALPTLAVNSSCLSVFSAEIVSHTPGSTKILPQVTVSLDGSTTSVGYDCFATHDYVCAPKPFPAGSQATTGWWRGQLVYLGRPGTKPEVPTDKNPEEDLPFQAFLLLVAIPGLTLLLAALLVFLAPMNVNELIQATLLKWPEPPRPVEARTVLAVAVAYQIWTAVVVWAILYIVGLLHLSADDTLRQAPMALLVAFLIAFVGAAVIASLRLWWVLRGSVRRTITITEIQTGQGRRRTKVWFNRSDGQRASTTLDADWYQQVRAGDSLDALTSPRSGAVRMLISTPPAQA